LVLIAILGVSRIPQRSAILSFYAVNKVACRLGCYGLYGRRSSVCVCVCVRERESEIVCVDVYVRERHTQLEGINKQEEARDRESERERMCVREAHIQTQTHTARGT